MPYIGPGNRRRTYSTMADTGQRPVLIDLTQDDSDDGMNVDEAVPSRQSLITSEGTDEQDFVSEDEDMDDNQSLSDHIVRALTPPIMDSPTLTTYQNKSPTPEEPSYVPSEDFPTEGAQSLCVAGVPKEPLDTSHDKELRDIHHLGLRRLTKIVNEITSSKEPDVTIKECRDVIARHVGLEGLEAFNTLIGLLNDNSSSFGTSGGSPSTSPFFASEHNHQETSGDDSDVPWEVFHSFLTIQRADFNSGKEFLQACEKLRRKVLITWNLQLTQKFTHTLFINAMRSYNPFLANVLRRVQLAGELEFHDLKRIIRMGEITDDTIIGHKTWGEWKAEQASPSQVGEHDDSDT
ncbi:hypothetical protein F4680DRAFT_469225 [Xylaria scruposa]|nr:hypothetical protein F4680DRAFT_469225 [Xylaria scruposa]